MIEILHETDSRIVCIKPAGVASQGTAPEAMPQLLSRQLSCAIYPVHRLDQAVGGVMVYARHPQAAAQLTQAMAEGRIEKTYLAVLCGCPEEKSGRMEDLLFHDRFRNKTYVVRRMRSGVKPARLQYEILAEAGGCSLARIRLETGRTHQIRVQFASRGYPLLGDGKYGSRENRCACALWSYRLQLPDGCFSALPPEGFAWTPFRQTLQTL